MKALCLALFTLALVHLRPGHGYSQQVIRHHNYSGGFISSTSLTSGSSSATSSSFASSHLSSSLPTSTNAQRCCTLNSWAQAHMHEVYQMANRVHLQYHLILSGKSLEQSSAFVQPWKDAILRLTGKTSSELDEFCHLLIRKIIENMRKGLITHGDAAQPNFFEWNAATSLEMLVQNNTNNGVGNRQVIGHSPYDNIDSAVRVVNGPPKDRTVDHAGIVVYGTTREPNHYRPDNNFEVQNPSNFPHVYIPVATHPPPVVGSAATDAWKHEEVKHFFWFLGSPSLTTEALLAWQQQEQARLQHLAQRYNVRLEEVHEWHRASLESFLRWEVTGEMRNNEPSWKQMERKRLLWLLFEIHPKPEVLRAWQLENQALFLRLVREYGISLQEFTTWQQEELKAVLNSPPPASSGLPDFAETHIQLTDLIRQHNATMTHLRNEILMDQTKLLKLSKVFDDNVKDMKDWLQNEAVRIRSALLVQKHQMDHITNWQRSERARLEDILQRHRGSVDEVLAQIKRDSSNLDALAQRYEVSADELRRWQQIEVIRLTAGGKKDLSQGILDWQQRERERLQNIIRLNNGTFEQLQRLILGDRKYLADLASTYKVELSELENWTRDHIREIAVPHLKQAIENETLHWRQENRNRILSLMQSNEDFIAQMKKQIKEDQDALYALMKKYPKDVDTIQQQLHTELETLKNKGLLEQSEVKEWEVKQHELILKLVRDNEMTAEEFERKLAADRERLKSVIHVYNAKVSEVMDWMQKEGERVRNPEPRQTQPTDWKLLERKYLLSLINESDSRDSRELESALVANKSFHDELRRRYGVSTQDINLWISSEVHSKEPQTSDIGRLQSWQLDWHNNVADMLRDRNFTIAEFETWLAGARGLLATSALENHMSTNELDRWLQNEKQQIKSMGLLQTHRDLTNWQIEQCEYLRNLSKNQFDSFEQLQSRLREDREGLEQVARRYRVQVDVAEKAMREELSRLLSNGELRIQNMSTWQVVAQEHLSRLLASRNQWNLRDFEEKLRKDQEHLRKIAFQYHITVGVVQKWLQDQLVNLDNKGVLVSNWHQDVQQQLLEYLERYSSETFDYIELKIKQDNLILQLAHQYRVSVDEMERFIRRKLEALRSTRERTEEHLKPWQQVELDFIKQVLAQHKDTLSLHELKQLLLKDRAHLEQLAAQFHITVEEIKDWIRICLRRLQQNRSHQKLAVWQVLELRRITELISKNQHLNYLQFEVLLLKDLNRLQKLAHRLTMHIDELLQWFSKQYIDRKMYGEAQATTSLSSWQERVQQQIIKLILTFPKASEDELRNRLHFRLSDLVKEINSHESLNSQEISTTEIESWMFAELPRLLHSGLFQTQELTEWQRLEAHHFQNWLIEHKRAHIDRVLEYFESQRTRLEQIALEHSTTVLAIELLLLQELVRMRLLHFFRIDNGALMPVMPKTDWKIQTRNELRETALIKRFDWSDLERHVVEERYRWELLAKLYNISVQEIEAWLVQVGQELKQQGVIREAEWQRIEKVYIEKLINERRTKQKNWSLEELEIFLLNDRQHIENLLRQFEVSRQLLADWYKQHLTTLLSQQLIFSEHLVDWQRREKERIYITLKQYADRLLTINELERLLLENKAFLQRLAETYRTTIEQLDAFIRSQLQRLLELELITSGPNSDWQETERHRLRDIASQIRITEYEFLHFISEDVSAQKQLSREYGIQLPQLAAFQRTEIGRMHQENLLDNIEVIVVEKWQRALRDNIFNLIKYKKDLRVETLHALKESSFLAALAGHLMISVQELMDWQLNEYHRLVRLSQQYSMTLRELQEFRENELNFILFVMHKVLKTQAEREESLRVWSQHIQALENRIGLHEEALRAWRRQLLLQCEGLVIINNIRPGGDQPPFPDVDVIDPNEPGLEDPWVHLSPVSSLPKKISFVGGTEVRHYHHHRHHSSSSSGQFQV